MSRVREFLRAAQSRDGGWGYKPGGMSFVEPTAAVMLALEPDVESAAQVQRARSLLKSWQRDDGGWGIAAMDHESGWMTAWALWALASTAPEAAKRGVGWLLQAEGVRIADAKEIADTQRILKIDATITGWSWQRGDAAWTFPTALALLALDRAGARSEARAREGVQYLLNRAIPTGGWNIGNPYMVTGNLPPTVENTTLALMALRAMGVENEVTQRAEAWLSQDGFTNTAFEWAWRGWYRKEKGESLVQVREALAKLQNADGSFDHNPFTTALAAMTWDE